MLFLAAVLITYITVAMDYFSMQVRYSSASTGVTRCAVGSTTKRGRNELLKRCSVTQWYCLRSTDVRPYTIDMLCRVVRQCLIILSAERVHIIYAKHTKICTMARRQQYTMCTWIHTQ